MVYTKPLTDELLSVLKVSDNEIGPILTYMDSDLDYNSDENE